jgi:LytS/YehU family sensor histidine kinase
MTFPWLFMSVLSPIACHWVRRVTLLKFKHLEDWPKRVVWSLLGYMFFTAGFAKVTYWLLSETHYAELVPSEKNFYGLLILVAMCVLITAMMYEGVTYFGKWKEALAETEQVEKLHLESQFQSLQSQLNPHFLFNSLNVLSSLIAENPRRAEDFVDELSNVYRYLLRSNERELASVGEEIRFIRSFFHLLETRHDTGISMKINVRPENFDMKLPTLALQILVENAVKHNQISPENPLVIEIVEMVEPVEVLRMRAQQSQPSQPAQLSKPSQPSQHKIIVRNNIQRKATRPHSNYVGLDNLRQRYALLGVSGFDVCDDGQFFSVTLPVIAEGA